MNERKAQLKSLKKAYNRAKRKHVTFWKIFGILFLLAAVVLSAGAFWVREQPLFMKAAVAAAAAWMLFLIFWIFWIRGNGKFKKTAGYLDYRTMKRAMKENG